MKKLLPSEPSSSLEEGQGSHRILCWQFLRTKWGYHQCHRRRLKKGSFRGPCWFVHTKLNMRIMRNSPGDCESIALIGVLPVRRSRNWSEGWYRKSERVLSRTFWNVQGAILRSREKLAKKFPVNLKILAFSLPGKFYFRDQFQIMHNLGPQMSFSMVVCPLPGSRKWRTSTAMHIATYNIGILPVRCT